MLCNDYIIMPTDDNQLPFQLCNIKHVLFLVFIHILIKHIILKYNNDVKFRLNDMMCHEKRCFSVYIHIVTKT